MPAQEFDVFRRSVKKGEILPAYYFHGDEDLLKDDALQDLLAAGLGPSTRDFNLDRRRAADLVAEEFMTLVLTPPMLAARRAVVVTEVEVLQQRRPRTQALKAAVVAYLAKPAPAPAPETLLVLVQSAGEKPDADLARLATAVAFEPLPPERLRRWIRHRAERDGLKLDAEGALLLHAAVGDDLAQLAAEIAKLRAAVGDGAATAADVADLVGIRRGETMHDFVDAVTARRFAQAAGMVPPLLASPGASGVRLVSGLGTALTGLALARSLLDRGAAHGGALARELVDALHASRPVGLRSWREEAERWASEATGWGQAELDAALGELLRADRRLKSPALGSEADIVAGAVLAIAGTAKVAA